MFFDVHANYLYGTADYTRCPQDLQMALAMVHQAHEQGCGAILMTPPDEAFLKRSGNDISVRFEELYSWAELLFLLGKMTREEVNHHADLIDKLIHNLNKRLNAPCKGIGEDVLESMAYLKARIKDPVSEMELFLGCEVSVDAGNVDRKIGYLREGKLPTLNGSPCVLVSFPDHIGRADLWYCLHELDQVGYVPVIAHAQTLRTFQEDDGIHEIRCLKGDGLRDPVYRFRALIQLDLTSLHFSAPDRHWAREMIEHQVVDVLGTDAKNSFTNPPHIQEELRAITQICDPAYLEAITCGNAQKRFVQGKEGN